MSCRFVFICTVIKWEMKDKKAKNKVRPNGKHIRAPKRRDGRKCATGQQQANRRNGDDKKTESNACKVGRETWRRYGLPRRAGTSNI